MLISAVFCFMITGVLVKALFARYWSAAVLALALAVLHTGLLVFALGGRTLPLLDAAIRKDPMTVISAAWLLPAVFWGFERHEHAEGSPRREVADLVMLLAILTFAQMLWALALRR